MMIQALKFGECFAYVLARITGEPLFNNGGDFARADIGSAPPYPPRVLGS